LVDRLEGIRLWRANSSEGKFDTRRAERDYAAAYREAGLGAEGEETEAVAAWRMRWETTRAEESTRAEEWKRKLTTYNMEDCAALRRVTEFVYASSARSERSPLPTLAIR
jgi:hypothetical protein